VGGRGEVSQLQCSLRNAAEVCTMIGGCGLGGGEGAKTLFLAKTVSGLVLSEMNCWSLCRAWKRKKKCDSPESQDTRGPLDYLAWDAVPWVERVRECRKIGLLTVVGGDLAPTLSSSRGQKSPRDQVFGGQHVRSRRKVGPTC